MPDLVQDHHHRRLSRREGIFIMIVSSHQAASKWCPLARPDKDGRGINRTPGGDPLPGSSCLGTGCMLWVEHAYERGYCGLAPVPRA